MITVALLVILTFGAAYLWCRHLDVETIAEAEKAQQVEALPKGKTSNAITIMKRRYWKKEGGE